MRNHLRCGYERVRGFTLFELIVTIVIVAVLAAIALPSFGPQLRGNRVTNESNDLLSAINMARTEAVSRAAPVSVCASTDGATCAGTATSWGQGWIVFVDYGDAGDVGTGDGDSVLRIWQAVDARDAVASGVAYLRFSATGVVTDPAGIDFPATFTLTPTDCSSDQKREISVAAFGRAETARTNCGT